MMPWKWKTSNSFRVHFGIGLCTGIVALASFVAFEQCWLTSGERNAAKTALVAIDGLQNLDTSGSEDFAVRVQKAEDAVEAARQTATTQCDQKVAFALMRYLGTTEMEHLSRIQEQSDSTTAQNLRLEGSPVATPVAEVHSLSSSLHETLE